MMRQRKNTLSQKKYTDNDSLKEINSKDEKRERHKQKDTEDTETNKAR